MTKDTSTLETALTQACEAVSDSCKKSLQHCETRIHESPVPTVLLAAGIGYAASILPVCRIGGALTRLGFSLVKPALLVIGVLKILECLEKKRCAVKAVEGMEREREPLIDSPTGPAQG